MALILFETELKTINSIKIIKLPIHLSAKLPSRGMVMATVTLKTVTLKAMKFQVALEPDGAGSHWFEVNNVMYINAKLATGETISVGLEPLTVWIEPEIPKDLLEALEASNLQSRWAQITTKARWDWIRWIRSSANPKTRQHRIEVTCSKLSSDKNRPCCFDRSRCTVPEVSKNGVLI